MRATVTTVYPEGQSDTELSRIFCLTRNYAAHAKEMGADPSKLPSIFMKPLTAIHPLSSESESALPYPSYGNDLHHEVEAVILCLDPSRARYAYGIGVDLTLRDIQAELKERSLPWEIAKGFDSSAPIGTLFTEDLLEPEKLQISLEVNGTLRQSGSVSDMVVPLLNIPAYVARWFPLRSGDLIFTGTPEGVAQLEREDSVTIRLKEKERALESLSFRVV